MEEVIPVIHKHFQKVEEKERISHLFYEARIIMVTKPNKDIIRKHKQNHYE